MVNDCFPIVSGPSRETLFDALRLVHEDRTVRFEWVRPDDVRDELNLKILAIGAYGDDNAPNGGQCWKVHGFDPDADGDKSLLIIYSTQSRTGTIQFCASCIVGPSPLPADNPAQEGFYVKVEKRGPRGGQTQFYVGPFANAQERISFLDDLKSEIEAGDNTAIVPYNAIPADWFSVAPEHFTGLDMFDNYIIEPLDDDEDPDNQVGD